MCNQATFNVWAQSGVCFHQQRRHFTVVAKKAAGSRVTDSAKAKVGGPSLQHGRERDREWCDGKQEVWALIKAGLGSVTLTNRTRRALSWLIPATGDTLTCCDPQGTKIHTIIYFTFMSSCVMKIKSKLSQGGPWFCFTFLLPSFSHLFFSFSLAAFLWSVNQILLMYESEVPTVHRRPLYCTRACRVQSHLSLAWVHMHVCSHVNTGLNPILLCQMYKILRVRVMHSLSYS